MGRARAAGLVLGAAADAAFADPRSGHPVAAFGGAAARLERLMWADSRVRGATYAVVCLLAAVAPAEAVRRATRRWSGLTGRVGLTGPTGLAGLDAPATAAATWAVLGGTTLAREALAMAESLEAGDLAAARRRLPHLCGRDPDTLDDKQLARASVESVAENTSDAVVAPLLWGAVFGVRGLVAYRAVNTLDAMVGHRTARHLRFGWAAARLDDAANWVPARVTGLLIVLWSPAVGGSRGRAWRVLRRDGGRHPSPNAGRCEAAMAGALGIRLGGANAYGGRLDHRPELGDGPPPESPDIRRAVFLSRLVSVSALALAVAVAACRGRRA